ncbi:MAG: aldo/keto reductase [Clostridiales bacterium]|nr:aldo/keto reductase [Clostridiales bacterium]
MKYRKIKDKEVSVLGLGCMRLETKTVNGKEVIDRDAFEEMIKYAVDNGVNYFDTAYMYHNGESEIALGDVVKRLGIRDKICIADKLPHWNLNCEADVERLINEQFEKVQTDYFDFYLLHDMSRKIWDEKIVKFGVIEKLLNYKEAGKIKYFGFSFHDDLDAFKYIVDSSDGVFDFCQLQINYADAAAGHQAGLEGLEYAESHGLAVVIMEPLKGGYLANTAKHVKEELPKGKSEVEYALDFLWDRKEVTVILSGMGNMEQLKQNIEYASRSDIGMLSEDERSMLIRAGEVFNKGANVQCTGCAYCMPCPAGIKIPEVFKLYNLCASVYTWETGPKQKYAKLDKHADDCLKCRKCEGMCPQHLKISEIMDEVAEAMK